MDKRYQVFVSSTYVDLREERQEVIQALLELDCIPSGMELFPAADEDQWGLIKQVIDEYDYYLLIVGGRYGSTNKDGVSYTEMEYRYALETGKPIVAFLHKELGKIEADKTESDPDLKQKLDAFRGLAKQKMCKFWTTPAELGSVVSRSVVNLQRKHPGVGWVRGYIVSDKEASQEILRLNKEVQRLEAQLIDARHKRRQELRGFPKGLMNIISRLYCQVGDLGEVKTTSIRTKYRFRGTIYFQHYLRL